MPRLRFPVEEKGKDSVRVDSVKTDTLTAHRSPLTAEVDTTKMDSLQLAIFKHNKAIDDSLHADSLNRERKNGIDAPVDYQADDSMTYEGASGLAHLYGNAQVKYQDMDLQSDQIFMQMDSSLVHATGSIDSTGVKFGTPVTPMRVIRWRLTSRRRRA